MKIPGTLFQPVTFKPFYQIFKGQIINGTQIYFTDRNKVNLCNLAVQILYTTYHAPGVKMFQPTQNGDSGPSAFDHVVGGDGLRLALQKGQTPEQIITSWQPGLAAFREARRPYLLYGERPKSDDGK
jgi:uncharacterized protein YbbC (DUF1343 family)